MKSDKVMDSVVRIKKIIFIVIINTLLCVNVLYANNFSSKIDKAKVVTLYGRKTTVNEMDTVTFGMYPQDSASKISIKDIEWLVLEKDVKNRKALLLSKYILDCKQFNDTYEAVTWKDCTLRKWLNNDFYNYAFNDAEKDSIILSNIVTKNNGNEVTEDKVFLLDTVDIDKYFRQFDLSTDNPKLATKGTVYARNIHDGGLKLWVRTNDKWCQGNSYFYLREMGVSTTNIAAVGSGGNIYGSVYHGSERIVNVNEKDGGVRPAIWVSY